MFIQTNEKNLPFANRYYIKIKIASILLYNILLKLNIYIYHHIRSYTHTIIYDHNYTLILVSSLLLFY